LVAREFAQNAEDILWRRSKLRLHMPAEGVAALEAYLAAR
jgi:glycerol-3-phosphate dehydrogenase